MALSDIFLTDVARDKDLVPTPAGDLAVISGVENLRAALYRRLITAPGSLLHRPEYGVGVGLYQNALARLTKQRELALKIQAQFELDPRVLKVLGVQITQNEDTPGQFLVNVRVQPVAIDEQTMTFIPFGEA